MPFALFDLYGAAVFLVIIAFLYKSGWFYSFYSFAKFILIAALTVIAANFLASHNPYNLPLTKLEQSLIIQIAVFAILWKFISFKKVFFKITDSILPINRFVFKTHIDRVMNLATSIVASCFLTFFLFTALVTISATSPYLSQMIQDSKIIKPLSYGVYFTPLSFGNNFNFKLFQGVAFAIDPELSYTGPGIPSLPNAPQNQNNQQGQQNYQPSNPQPQNSTPQKQNPPQTHYIPVIPIFMQPNPTPIPAQVEQPTPTVFIQQQTNPQTNPPQTNPPAQTQPTQPIAPATPPSADISEVEQAIFNLTNQQRAQNGVGPLVLDTALSDVARAHSQDMSARNFFDHVNPDGQNPFDRMHAAGIDYTTAGENIAGGPTADIIMTNWMNSPGHRANILNPAFGHIGIGVAQSSQYGLLATQDFMN